jgi:hypothetical protein
MKTICVKGHDTSKQGRTKLGQCKECKKNWMCKANQKAWQLRWRYGIPLEEYNKVFQEQAGNCKLCGLHQSVLRYSLAVDHNHKSGQIRGLLCSNCNTGLGLFKDDISLLQKATQYLRI